MELKDRFQHGECFYSPDLNKFIMFSGNWTRPTFEDEYGYAVVVKDNMIDNLKRIDANCSNFHSKKPEKLRFYLYPNYIIHIEIETIVGYYRGEDSGARYPEYEDVFLGEYDLSQYIDFPLIDTLTLKDYLNTKFQIGDTYYTDPIYKFLYEHPELCISGEPINRRHKIL